MRGSYDLVVVVDGGRVAEVGPPGVLAADPTSRLAALLRAGDPHHQRGHVREGGCAAPAAHVR